MNVIYFCVSKAELLQSSVSYSPSEIILIRWFALTFIIIMMLESFESIDNIERICLKSFNIINVFNVTLINTNASLLKNGVPSKMNQDLTDHKVLKTIYKDKRNKDISMRSITTIKEVPINGKNCRVIMWYMCTYTHKHGAFHDPLTITKYIQKAHFYTHILYFTPKSTKSYWPLILTLLSLNINTFIFITMHAIKKTQWAFEDVELARDNGSFMNRGLLYLKLSCRMHYAKLMLFSHIWSKVYSRIKAYLVVDLSG